MQCGAVVGSWCGVVWWMYIYFSSVIQAVVVEKCTVVQFTLEQFSARKGSVQNAARHKDCVAIPKSVYVGGYAPHCTAHQHHGHFPLG